MRKGFTLIEMVATLIVLSIVAVIVTPNIYVSIKEYKNRLFDTQMDNIKQSAKNWAVDHVDSLPSNNTTALAIKIQDLQNDGYISDNLENPKGGFFDNSDVFVLITCDYIEDQTGNLASNYKYIYEVYESVTDYMLKAAIKYAQDSNFQENKTVKTSDLKDKYIKNNINIYNSGKMDIPNQNITINVITSYDSKTGDTIYRYDATI